MAVTGTSHRTPPRGIIPNRGETGDRITMDRTNDSARTISHQAKGRQVFPLLDRAAQTPARPDDEACADAMTTPGNALQHLYCILRCNRWGVYVRWSQRNVARNPKPAEMRSWWGPIVLDGNVEQDRPPSAYSLCPVDVAEALETQACIDKLPKHLKRAMIQEHVLQGTQRQKANALEIDRTSFWRRCERAYQLLLGMFNDAGAGLPIEEPKE